MARGRISAASDDLFQAELSHKRYYLFKKEDASEYHKPNVHASIRCIYHGDKNNLLPYAVYDLLWNLIWKEK
jgi:predicted cupin superfamily sugar epimerase